MNSFLDRFKPPKNGGGRGNNNPFANFFGGGNSSSTKSFSGQGQSLGGNQPGQVIPIVLVEPGPLGIQLEKRNDRKTAIIGNVVAGSQAETVGLQRGDILCFAGSNGSEDILYDMFLELATSQQRPLCFEVRRIVAAAGSSSSATTGAATSQQKPKSADDFARRQAVIAAAELREKAHKKKLKPIAKSDDTSKLLMSTAEKARIEQEQRERQLQPPEPLSAATLQAKALAKASEAKTAQEFGYNPYESKSMNAGQARNAVTTSTHGPIVQPTTNETAAGAAAAAMVVPRHDIPANVQLAFEIMVTSSHDIPDGTTATVVDSLKIVKTLIANATTKGQTPGQEKFRTVRLENAKIKAALNVSGAMDVLLDCGFQLQMEEDDSSSSILVYPILDVIPNWISSFLQQVEQYIQNS